ncbi:MAG: helix-turn-helix domain-containing protein [Rikenellaceae bacterium]
MLLYEIIPLMCSFAFLFTLIAGIIIIYRVAEPTHQRHIFLCILIFWVMLMMIMIRRQFLSLEVGVVYSGYMNNRFVSAGTIGFLTLIVYGASVIFNKRYNFKNFLLFISPAIIAYIVNIIIIQTAHIPATHIYTDIESFKANIATPPVISLIILLSIQFLYACFLTISTIQIVPIYNKYIKEHESEERYSMSWLYGYTTAVIIIVIAYFVTAIRITYYTQIIYSVIANIAFIILIDCVRTFKFFPKFNEIQIKLTLSKGWVLIEPECEKPSGLSLEQLADRAVRVRSWIIATKPYSDPHFSVNDLLKQFPEMNNHDVTTALAERGHTFQSYIREHRILEAITLIKQDKNKELLFKDIYYKVGFSHYSSFARAFTLVTGQSPSNYTVD